ncbi:hypothetical protein ONS96_014917 [Cadophora gregata f. sp. sojae]|nr:hypothetical protein ONS96_014917 [Cadophora gregata f. sp. sojae]
MQAIFSPPYYFMQYRRLLTSFTLFQIESESTGLRTDRIICIAIESRVVVFPYFGKFCCVLGERALPSEGLPSSVNMQMDQPIFGENTKDAFIGNGLRKTCLNKLQVKD